MKKTILLIMMIFSSFVFGNSFEKSFGERITDRIKFGMTKEEFSRSVSKAPLSNSHSKLEGNLCYPSLVSKAPLSNSYDNGRYAVYYYSGVEDPLGIPRNLTSFNYVDNRLVSAIFDSQTTEEEHKKIVKAYSKNQSNFRMASSICCGSVFEEKRSKTCPSRPMRNLAKFHSTRFPSGPDFWSFNQT